MFYNAAADVDDACCMPKDFSSFSLSLSTTDFGPMAQGNNGCSEKNELILP